MTSTSTTSPTPRAATRTGYRWLAPILLANLVAEVGIDATGGLVRVTGSGLGCPTWPECVDGSITPTIEQPEGIHKYIEFGNRTLTGVLLVLALATVVVVWRTAPRRAMKVAAGLVLGGVVGQAVLGGVTVLLGLNPAVVAAHFLVSMGLVAASSYLVDAETAVRYVREGYLWNSGNFLFGAATLIADTRLASPPPSRQSRRRSRAPNLILAFCICRRSLSAAPRSVRSTMRSWKRRTAQPWCR